MESRICDFCGGEGYHIVHVHTTVSSNGNICQVCPICKGPRLVIKFPCRGVVSFRPEKETDTTEGQVQQSADCCYLIIVRYDPDCDAWVVDEDSRHILEDDGGGVTPQELQVHTLRSLPQSVPWREQCAK